MRGSRFVLILALLTFAPAASASAPPVGRVSDVNPGFAGSLASEFTPLGGVMVFSAVGDGTGREIWKTDGTEAGTTLLKDINPGPTSSNAFSFARVGNTVF